MGYFWEKSREYLRAQELYAELEAAEKARDEAGKGVLMCVSCEIDTPRNDRWREARQRFLDADAAYFDLSGRWRDAREAFRASPAGKAEARYWADPLAVRLANGPAFYASVEFAEAAE